MGGSGDVGRVWRRSGGDGEGLGGVGGVSSPPRWGPEVQPPLSPPIQGASAARPARPAGPRCGERLRTGPPSATPAASGKDWGPPPASPWCHLGVAPGLTLRFLQVQEVPAAVPALLERPWQERDLAAPVSPVRRAVSPGRRQREVTPGTSARGRGGGEGGAGGVRVLGGLLGAIKHHRAGGSLVGPGVTDVGVMVVAWEGGAGLGDATSVLGGAGRDEGGGAGVGLGTWDGVWGQQGEGPHPQLVAGTRGWGLGTLRWVPGWGSPSPSDCWGHGAGFGDTELVARPGWGQTPGDRGHPGPLPRAAATIHPSRSTGIIYWVSPHPPAGAAAAPERPPAPGYGNTKTL